MSPAPRLPHSALDTGLRLLPAAALLSRYVDVPALGPIPARYEPVRFPEKVVATAAEAVGTLTAAAGWVLARTSSRVRTRPGFAGERTGWAQPAHKVGRHGWPDQLMRVPR